MLIHAGKGSYPVEDKPCEEDMKENRTHHLAKNLTGYVNSMFTLLQFASLTSHCKLMK
jgi:hypothetical protein